MTTWILVFVLLHVDATSTQDETTGIASRSECEQMGRARMAQAYRRENTTDIATYRCKAKEPKGQER